MACKFHAWRRARIAKLNEKNVLLFWCWKCQAIKSKQIVLEKTSDGVDVKVKSMVFDDPERMEGSDVDSPAGLDTGPLGPLQETPGGQAAEGSDSGDTQQS